MKRVFRQALAMMVLLLFCTSANATIISVTGSGGILGSDPADLTIGGSESALVQGFNEAQDVSVGANSVSVTYLNPNGSYTGNDTLSEFLEAGTYSSHIIHYDPIGTSGGNTGTISAEFTFDGLIVGLITSNSLLAASDSIFGLSTLTYDATAAGRRAEDTDTFSVAGNTFTATFFTTGGLWFDEVRVVTVSASPVPEPSTLILLGSGLAGLAWCRRKQK